MSFQSGPSDNSEWFSASSICDPPLNPALVSRITPSKFRTDFPKWSKLLPHIYNLTTTLVFFITDINIFKEDNILLEDDQIPKTLSGVARLAIEIITKAHLREPRGVDISKENPLVEKFLPDIVDWCIEDFITFRESCRREGRAQVPKGYGFSGDKEDEENEQKYVNIVTSARYLHYFPYKKVSWSKIIYFLLSYFIYSVKTYTFFKSSHNGGFKPKILSCY
jgi:hypothetical protein